MGIIIPAMFLSGPGHKGMRVEVVTGAPAILDRIAALHQAAENWEQSEELAELPYLLSVPLVPPRDPLLVLLYSGGEAGSQDNLAGAVLLFAYAAQFAGVRLLAHPDRTGRRCVFGPAANRTAIAVTAARAMLQRGAKVIVLPYRVEALQTQPERELTTGARRQRALAALGMLGLSTDVEWTLRVANRRLELPLEPTLDATLERVGKRTRRNLRAATRLCQRETGAELLWNPGLELEALARFNAQSTHPVRRSVLNWRYAIWRSSARQGHPATFLAGLRDAQGEWLALAGGRRYGDSVTLDWQMNGKEFARYSVSLVMRGLLIARFGAEGATRMRFEGGTAHTLSGGFNAGAVYVLQVRQRTIWLRLLERILTRWFPSRAITRNLFGQRRTPASGGKGSREKGEALQARDA